jgi:hypothetical protein
MVFGGVPRCLNIWGRSVSSISNDDSEFGLRIKAAGDLFGKWRKSVFQHRNIPFSCKKLAYEGTSLATLIYFLRCLGNHSQVVGHFKNFTATPHGTYMCRVTTEHMWKYHIDTETLEDRVASDLWNAISRKGDCSGLVQLCEWIRM